MWQEKGAQMQKQLHLLPTLVQDTVRLLYGDDPSDPPMQYFSFGTIPFLHHRDAAEIASWELYSNHKLRLGDYGYVYDHDGWVIPGWGTVFWYVIYKGSTVLTRALFFYEGQFAITEPPLDTLWDPSSLEGSFLSPINWSYLVLLKIMIALTKMMITMK